MHSLSNASSLEHLDRAGLDDPSADAAEHMLAGLPLEHYVRNTLLQEKLAEQEPRGTRSDDDDLCVHDGLK